MDLYLKLPHSLSLFDMRYRASLYLLKPGFSFLSVLWPTLCPDSVFPLFFTKCGGLHESFHFSSLPGGGQMFSRHARVRVKYRRKFFFHPKFTLKQELRWGYCGRATHGVSDYCFFFWQLVFFSFTFVGDDNQLFFFLFLSSFLFLSFHFLLLVLVFFLLVGHLRDLCLVWKVFTCILNCPAHLRVHTINK